MSATAEAYTGPLGELKEGVEHLLKTLDPLSVFGNRFHPTRIASFGEWTLSINTVYFLISAIVVVWIGFAVAKRMSIVPKGRLMNAFEFLVEFVRNNVANIIKHDQRKYEPFLLTCFFFILISNLIGLIPGVHPGTGIIGGTLALAITVLVYFNAVGMKAKGGLKYWLGLVPNGVPVWLAPIIWIIEFVSMLLRPITLALRLFANMYAGHIILGIFGLLTGLFAEATLIHHSGALIAASPAWLLLLIAMYVLELVVAFVQAYVFSLLTAVYIDGAVSGH
ncbi:MAG: F0F1 ATP synthase subunit A [Actinomycetes bacterium]|jgi:F-type H+-transporting ATPase subunit a|nr:F0F1 ATP synthase subunit A [Actinomycetes bacterium]